MCFVSGGGMHVCLQIADRHPCCCCCPSRLSVMGTAFLLPFSHPRALDAPHLIDNGLSRTSLLQKSGRYCSLLLLSCCKKLTTRCCTYPHWVACCITSGL
jgi:hypothetical protein